MNPIGVHFIPVHTGRYHYDFIDAMQPGVMKVVGSGFPDVQLLADAYQAAPNARHVWRDHALSEQHSDLWNNPAATGARHAEEMSNHADEAYTKAAQRGLALPFHQVMLLGVNEPVIELFARNEDMSNYDEWLHMTKERASLLDLYMVEFGRDCNRRGYSAGLGNFSSGQPANIRPGEYPTFAYWFPLTTQFLQSAGSKAAANALVVHEYWRAETGPEGWWDWHTCRFKHLDVDCDIFVLECGVDQLITDEDWHGNRGWQGHMPPAAYADHMRRYIERCRQDSRFRCATPFTLDGAKEWESFYIEPVMSEFIALSEQLRIDAPQTPPPVISPGPTEPPEPPPTGNLFERSLEFVLLQEGGWADNPADPGGATMKGITLGTYTRWRELHGQPPPTKADLRNISDAEVRQIYHDWYWLPSGANSLPWPNCLAVFDLAVNGGVGRAQQFKNEVGTDFLAFNARRLEWYTRINGWPTFGAAWTRRVAALLKASVQ